MNIPMILKQNDNHSMTYDLYSLLLTYRIIFLSGEINDTLANTVIGELLYLDKEDKKDIYLYINSPGGAVTSGLAIYDTIKFINSKLTKREKYIMCSRYGLNGHIQKTQQQIADELGISRSYVSRIETKVQNKLKKYVKWQE